MVNRQGIGRRRRCRAGKHEMVDRGSITLFGGHFPVSKPNTALTPSIDSACFRYVAMHTMQEEDTQSGAQDESQMNGFLDSGGGRNSRQAKPRKDAGLVLAAVGGMLLPLLTQIGHAH